VNVDRRWLGRSGVRVRVLAAGLVLLAAGGMVLGWGSRSHLAATAGTYPPAIENGAGSASLPAALPSGATQHDARMKASSLMARLPLMFEPNLGQANLDPSDTRARFIARGSGYTLFLGTEGAIVSLRSTEGDKASKRGAFSSFQMKLAGANPKASLTATDLLPAKSNYLLGNDPAKWRSGIPQYARVRYESIYPGISLVFYGNQGRLEYDLQVAPGADPAQAELEFDGAKSLELKNGALVVKGASGDARLEAPRVYQLIAGRQQAVEGEFVLRGGNRAGFSIGPYDATRELVIDPNLSFSTYFGGTGDEHASSIAIDGAGNIYLAGSTTSPTLPVGTLATVFQSTLAGTQNVYIAKINPVLNPPLQYVTFLGGTGSDSPVGIGVDGAGDPIVAGTTSSPLFPTTATAYQANPEPGSTGTRHVFVSKLNPTASALLYSTYLSGSGDDVASGMTIDGSENVYVTGTTTSTKPQDVGSATGPQFPSSSLPYATPFQSTPLASIQFFVTQVNTGDSGKRSIIYSTYFGGANTATSSTPIVVAGGGIAVDTNGNIYFDGTTNFTYTNGAVGDFPILNAYQACLDSATSVVAVTNPPPCTNTSTTTPTDAFVAKLNPNPQSGAQGQQLQWSTYFGGLQTDSATGIALDSGAANVYIVGTTNSYPITSVATFAAYQVCLNTPINTSPPNCVNSTSTTPTDAFVARFTNPTTSTTGTTNVSLNYFSYLGGTGNDAGQAITVDSAAGALLTGWTQSTDFPVAPTPGDIQSSLVGTQDAFVARLNTVTVTGQNTSGSWSTYFGQCIITLPPPGPCLTTPAFTQGTSVALDVNQNTYFAGDTNSNDLQVTVTGSQAANSGGFDAFVTELQTTANLSIVGVLTLGTNQAFINAGNNATFTYTLTNNGPDLASNITVNIDLDPRVTVVPLTFVSANTTSGTCSAGATTTSVSCSIQSLQPLSTATITVVVTPKPYPNGSQATFNGGAVQVLSANGSTVTETSVSANMADFALAVTPPNRSVHAAGDTAFYTVQLTPNPTYTTAISISCSGLGTGMSCSPSPASVNLQGSSPGTATLSIGTTARPISTGGVSSGSKRVYAVWLVLPGFAVLGLGLGGDRRRGRIVGVLLLCVVGALLLFQPACSSSSTAPPTSGTQAGIYNITVTATSGGDSKSQGIQLSVP
jgi:hypothetical protein